MRRSFDRELKRIEAKTGAKAVEISTANTSHARVMFEKDGKRALVYLGTNDSDHRAFLNKITSVRRGLAQ